MKLFDFIKNFGKDEDGAVTVDWVVLTAALVGLGILILSVVRGGLEDLSSDIATELSGIDPGVAVSTP
jgi:Flp pilus assembly pilin Flp